MPSGRRPPRRRPGRSIRAATAVAGHRGSARRHVPGRACYSARPMDGAIDVLVRYGYVVVFGWVFAEQIGLPIPAAPVLLAAGALAGTGRLSLALVLGLAGLASLGSDIIWYWIGRTGGGRVLRWLCRISLEPDSCVRRTEDAFSVHGARSLLYAKFVPGYSTAAPPLAGIVRMPLLRFVVFTRLGGLTWAGVFVGVGWLFSRQPEVAAHYVARLGSPAVALRGARLGGRSVREDVVA